VKEKTSRRLDIRKNNKGNAKSDNQPQVMIPLRFTHAPIHLIHRPRVRGIRRTFCIDGTVARAVCTAGRVRGGQGASGFD